MRSYAPMPYGTMSARPVAMTPMMSAPPQTFQLQPYMPPAVETFTPLVQPPPVVVQVEDDWTHDMVPFEKRTGKTLFQELGRGQARSLFQKTGRTPWQRFLKPLEVEHTDFQINGGLVPLPKSKVKQAEQWLDENEPKRLQAFEDERVRLAALQIRRQDLEEAEYKKQYNDWWDKNWGTKDKKFSNDVPLVKGFY